MSGVKSKFYCKVHRIWMFWTQNNHGKCTICDPAKPIKPEPSKK